MLAQKYIALQKKYHPDFFANGTEHEQEQALEISSQLNKALKVLKNQDQTIKYVLQLKNLLEEEEKYQLPSDFLMEMMELNEAWMEADDEASKQSILSQIKAIQDEILEPIKDFLEMDQIDTISQEAMLQIKEYYYKKKYLDRILAEFR